MERKNKWLSSWPDRDVQSVSEEEELFGKSHSHPTQVLPRMGLGAPAAPSTGEGHGDQKSPQPRAGQMLEKGIWKALSTEFQFLLHRKANPAAFHHNIQ